MTSFAQLARGAGLMTPDRPIVIPNFELPFVSRSQDDSLHPSEPLFCNREFGTAADLTLLYFTLPECENCRPSARELGRLREQVFADVASAPVKLCTRLVVSDWSTSAEVAQEWTGGGFKGFGGIVWDPNGALGERLAVVAQPAFYMLDSTGRVLAYQNGPVELDSVGFGYLWGSLSKELRSEQFKASGSKLGDQFSVERENLSSQPVSFLNVGVLPVLWLVVSVALCYSLVRFFLRLRKNFTGSKNSS